MERKSQSRCELSLWQHELLTCVSTVKNEFSEAIVGAEEVQALVFDNIVGEETKEKLDMVLEKMKKAQLTLRGLKDFMEEIDSTKEPRL